MKLLSSIKQKSFRKSKKDGKSTAQDSASTSQVPIAPVSTSDVEDSADAASPVTPSPAKESPQIDAESAQVLRPLHLGSYDYTTSYIFPSLHEEASSMVELSMLIYTLSELRDLARNGVLNDPSKSLRILQMPLPLETAFGIMRAEADLLKEVLGDGKHDASLSALMVLLQKKKEVAVKQEEVVEKGGDQGILAGFMDSWNGCLAGGFSFDELFCGGDLKQIDAEKDNAESSMIYTVGDAKCFKELVYAIEVNPNEERITVIFRGSVTKRDFAAEANVNMIRVAEPTTDPTSSEAGDIGLHQGFYEYLFGSKNGKPCKYEQIMGHVQKLFRQDANRQRHYKLMVTGHGLGGALATLFGYYCAALSSKKELSFATSSRREDLPLPVTVVSIGSPRIGDLAFARSFTELESRAKLRHLRIAAHKDPMTLVPIHSSKPLPLSKALSPLAALAFSPIQPPGDEDVYYHTGMSMNIREDFPSETSQRCEMIYSGARCVPISSLKCSSELDDRVQLESLIEESKQSGKSAGAQLMATYHYGEGYSWRLSLVFTDVSGLSLNRLYREKACSLDDSKNDTNLSSN